MVVDQGVVQFSPCSFRKEASYTYYSAGAVLSGRAVDQDIQYKKVKGKEKDRSKEAAE